MSIQLDHAIVPVRDRKAAAELLAYLLDVPWAESGTGPFSPVYVNGGRIVYWNEPDGHVWEALTVSYARQPRESTN